MIRYLAESEHFKVTAEYETVYLQFKMHPGRRRIIIGDFYGDPQCAIISCDEKYVAIAGAGLIIYRLQEPFDSYQYETSSRQYAEFFRFEPKLWWLNGLHQDDIDQDCKYFRFIAANDEGLVIYRMDACTFELKKQK